ALQNRSGYHLKGAHKMNMPGFSADASLYGLSGLHPMAGQAIRSGDSKSQVYPARLKNEDEGVDCDSCIGAQCVELHCLERSSGVFDPGGDGPGGGGGGGGGGGNEEPCLNSHVCSACVPTGPSIFSPGRQFCTDSFCSLSFGGKCVCQVFKGFRNCQVPRPVLTSRFR